MYIRTKDRIYEVKREEILCGVKFYDYETEDHLNRIREEHTIKQADNIKELCDGFYIEVCKPIFEKEFIYSKEEYYDFHYMITQYLKKNGVIYTAYGFIKISKGLKYVARLNDKGEFELI